MDFPSSRRKIRLSHSERQQAGLAKADVFCYYHQA